jgi:hypothetical protein
MPAGPGSRAKLVAISLIRPTPSNACNRPRKRWAAS